MPQTTTSSPALPAPSRLRRCACMIYEGMLLFGVVFLAGYILDTLTQSRSGLTLRHLRQAILFLAIGVYFVMSWRFSGQTLPMKTWNIRIAERDGTTPGLSRLVLRYILAWCVPLLAAMAIRGISHASGVAAIDLLIVFAPFALFLWTWFDRDGQFLHDRLLGTRLVSV